MLRTWPQPLRAGDLVVAIAPSGPADPDRVAEGIAVVESWGLRVHLAPHVFSSHDRLGYLAAPDRARAADLQQAWCDPEVRAVWAVRGGYGAQRMVDLLDWTAMRAAAPKQLIGYSDVTALHARLGRELNQTTIHGPGLGSFEQLGEAASADALRRLLFDEAQSGTLLATGRPAGCGPSTGSGDVSTGSGEVSTGSGDVGGGGSGHRGLLIGGNLSLIAGDVGIEPAPDETIILLLEEVNEPTYRIDRMLTQLLRSRWLAKIQGVVVGDLGLPDDTLLLDRLGPLGVPILCGVEAGHGSRNVALPLGADVRLDVGQLTGTLSLG